MACSALAGPLDEQAATEALDSVLGPLYEVGHLFANVCCKQSFSNLKFWRSGSQLRVHAKYPSDLNRPGQGLYRLAHAFQSRQNKFRKIQFWGIYSNHDDGKPHAVQFAILAKICLLHGMRNLMCVMPVLWWMSRSPQGGIVQGVMSWVP